VPTGWNADGSQVTLVSRRETDHGRSGQWYQVSLDGGAPVKQMDARVFRGSLSANGKQLAYIAFGSGYNGLFGGTAGWKGYRGGTTPAIQVLDLEKPALVTVEGARATNFNPLWLDGQLYFLSDREEKTFNLYHYDPLSQDIRKISSEQGWDILSAAGHGNHIVYTAGGRLKELDVKSGALRSLEINISPDLPQTRPQWKDASGNIQALDFSATGKRVAITARGEVFTVPVEHGSTRNITNSGTLREYSALWSPLGTELAYITESLEGQSLHIVDQLGAAKAKPVQLGPHFYELLEWVNDDRPRIVYADNHLGLHVLDIKSGKHSKIATAARRTDFATAVSSDGAWLAYTLEIANNNRQLVLHNFDSGKQTTLAGAGADADSPAFSPDGKFLYFAASTNSGPLKVGLNMSTQERPFRAGLYALVLAADGDSPLAPRPGDEDGSKDDSEDEDDKKAETPATRIDFADLSLRIVPLPGGLRNYGNLEVAEDGNLYYLQYVQPGSSEDAPGEDSEEANSLWRFDFEEREASLVLEDVSAFALSSDGKQILLSHADASLSTAELDEELEPEPLSLDGLRVHVSPREEWAQIFDETWRMEQEYF
jgi:tricorn protease